MSLALAVLLAVPLVPVDLVGLAVNGPDGAQQRAEAAAFSITITLGPDDWTSSSPLVLEPDGDVTWRNRSGRTLAVTSPDGLLDSGPIPDGGSYVASIPSAGTYEWSTDVGSGAVLIGAQLDGAGTDNALASIPELTPPPRDPDDIGVHPDLVVPLSRSTAIVGFSATATVSQATSALGTDWVIVGGLPNVGLVYVRLAKPEPTFADLDAALATLRAQSAVDFAAHDWWVTDTAIPPPTPEQSATDSTWEPPQVSEFGLGLNWTQEITRLPAAWNLNDALAATGRTPHVGIIDSGFSAHVDLDRLDAPIRLCTSGLDPWCTKQGPSEHGDHVAGIVGADFDDVGVTGASPFVRMTGVSWKFDQSTLCEVVGPVVGQQKFACEVSDGAIEGQIPVAMSLLLDELASGRLPAMDVLNLSVQLVAPEAADWWATHQSDTCGPGPSDDGSGSLACHPSVDDVWLAATTELGKAYRRVITSYVERLGAATPLVVHSAGNASNDYCEVDRGLTCLDELATPQRAVAMSGLAWANQNWDRPDLPNPILTVEGLGRVERFPDGDSTQPAYPTRTFEPSTKRAYYSNLGDGIPEAGRISAPGRATSTCGPPKSDLDSYCTQEGTSQAAPLVAGVAAALAHWEPDLTATDLKERLVGWSVPDTSEGASARIDAFGALYSLPGAVKALVDVNDPSQDGNRRVVYAPDGAVSSVDTEQSTEAGRFTEPDGVVDMRDFRRFRDAWLERCLIEGEPGCPAPSDIDLDGPLDHPKRDLNLDGEVAQFPPAEAQSVPSELTFPRFDFNGDGTISAVETARVPLATDGTPATGPGDAGAMTDLDVLASQWDAQAPGSLGVEAADLPALLRSGDLTLAAAGLAGTGATEAMVTVVDDATDAVVDTYTVAVDGGADPVLTVPAATPHRLVVRAEGTDGVCEGEIGPFTVAAGQDRLVSLDATLSAELAASRARPDSQVALTIRAASCGADPSGALATATITPAVADGATFGDGSTTTTVPLEEDGSARLDVLPGTVDGRYTIEVTADLPALGGVATRRASDTLVVSALYGLEVAAVDGDSTGYTAVDEFFSPGSPLGPSVDADGDVAFGALEAGADSYEVYSSEPGDNPTDPAEADVLSGGALPPGTDVVGQPELNDRGDVAFATRLVDGDVLTNVLRGSSSGAPEELATGVSTFGGTTERFEEVTRPTINNDGRTIFRATTQGGEDVLAEKQGELVVEGPATAFARPQLADDGTTVLGATVARPCADYPGVCGPGQSQLLDPIVLVGEGLQATRSVLAEARVDGWETIGDPDISDPGDVIAFVADREGQRGLWIAVRRPDGLYQPPIAVAGPAAPSSDLLELDLDRPSLVQLQRAPDGPAGDRVVLAVRGVATASAGPATNGVHTVPVDLVATGETAIPYFPRVRPSQLVAQVGDTVDGRTIDSVRLGDSLAVASSPAFPDDHWVAFFARTDDERSMYIRARALPPPLLAASGLVSAIMGWAQSVATTVLGWLPSADSALPAADIALPAAGAALPALDPGDVQVQPGPHIAALTITDDTPVAREPTPVVNRSRALDGTPAWAILDETTATGSDILANPVPLPPDGEYLVTWPTRGTLSLKVGAPLTAGEFASDAQFVVQVGPGENRAPAVSIPDGPFLLAPGQPLDLEATGADPDGDRVTYAWDLDDDGRFDDNALRAFRLDANQVADQICGGTCTLDTPYPVAVQISDDRGLDATARTTVTVSGLDDIVVRLEPALTRINPGAVGSAFVAVDAPAGSPTVPVDITAEGVPEGWNVSVPSSMSSGQTRQITVRVPSDAPEDSFSFDIVATAGEVTKRATLTVVTVFGLIPQCQATIAGVVTDENGTPVPAATFSTSLIGSRQVTSDAEGRFSQTVTLRAGFETDVFTWTAARDARREPPFYLSATGGPSYARCDETTQVDPALAIVDPPAGVTSRAVVGLENPVNPSRPIPTTQALTDVSVTASYTPGRFLVEQTQSTGADGRTTFTDIPVQDSSGRDLSVGLTAQTDGYWSASSRFSLSPADAFATVDIGDLALVPACTGTVTGGFVVDQLGDPVEGARVRIRFSGDPFVLSGPDGSFTLNTEAFLGQYNRARTVTLEVLSPTDWTVSDRDFVGAFLGSCGASSEPVTAELQRPEPPPPPPQEYFGSLLGTVTDADTGEPVVGAYVDIFYEGSYQPTDGIRDGDDTALAGVDGTWGPRRLLLGVDDPTVTRDLTVRVQGLDYVVDVREVTVAADTEVRLDVELERRPRAELSGFVTDVETGELIEGARVATSAGYPRGFSAPPGAALTRTAADGSYSLPGLFLGDDDSPREVTVSADFGYLPFGSEPYWPTRATTTLVEGENSLDLQMLRVCDGATVRGVVLNAATLEPLEGVLVRANARTDTTDAEGRYEITDIRVDTDNQPRTIAITASKEGFDTARAEVTGFCEAEIIVDFGQPPGGFGSVGGTVTDAETGDPLPDVFVGSSWGDSTTTAADGTYLLDRAPLTSDGGPREWTITAASGAQRLSKPVTVSADEQAVADFAFAPEQNLPPVADGQTVQTEPGQPVEIVLTGRDPEGADVTFTVQDDPTNGALSGTPPALTYTPGDAFTGTDTFTVTASDGELTSEPATITVVVEPAPNQPPTISAPVSIKVGVGETREYAVAGNDPDDDPLTVALVDDADGRASLVDAGDATATVTFVSRDDDTGSFDVVVSVTDGQEFDQATTRVEIDVPTVDQPPVPDLSLPETIVEGDTVTFDGSGSTDPEGGDLSYAWTLVDFGGNTVATGSGPTWSYGFGDDFVGGIRLTVTDPADNDAMLEEDVVVANAAPQPSAQTVPASSDGIQAGQQVTLQGTISDAGVDDTHTVSVDWGDGTSEPLAVTDRSFTGQRTYRQAGEFEVTVTATDDDGDSGRVTLPLVVAAAPDDEPVENSAPTASDVAVATDAGEPVELLLEGDDPDGDPVTFRVVTEPGSGTLSGSPPNLRYTPDEGFDGVDTFTYVAFDGVLDSEPATVEVTVRPAPNRPPQITLPASVEIDAGQTRDVEVVVTEPDGDEVVVTVADDGGGRASLLQGIDLADAGAELAELVEAALSETLVLQVVTTVEDAGAVFDVSIRASDEKGSVLATMEVTVLAPSAGDGQPAPDPSVGESGDDRPQPPAETPTQTPAGTPQGDAGGPVLHPRQQPGPTKAPTSAMASTPSLPPTGAAAAPLLVPALLMVVLGAALLRRSRT